MPTPPPTSPLTSPPTSVPTSLPTSVPRSSGTGCGHDHATPADSLTRRTVLRALAGTAGLGVAGVVTAGPALAGGREHSPNGWPVAPDPAAIGVVPQAVPGTSVVLPVVGGAGGTVLVEVARRFSRDVQPLTYACWGYAYRANTNSPGVWSNHASGTAIDLNSQLHPNGAVGTFTGAQVRAVEAIVADMRGVVRWGGDYTGTVDAMHYELDVHPGHWRLRGLARDIARHRY